MLGEIIADLSNWMYTYLLVILLVAAGLFFTIRNRFPQLRLLREAIRVVVERPEKFYFLLLWFIDRPCRCPACQYLIYSHGCIQ